MKKIVLFFLISSNLFAFNVDTLIVFSPSMQKMIPNIVITPDSYSKQQNNFPVLYLLHGASGDFTNWTAKVPEIRNYADLYNIIIVCPDGHETSWYFDSPMDNSIKYETYISKELIEQIDKRYHTIRSKKGRGITGLSMGGHGAFYLAFKHLDIFGAAGSMSGGVNLEKFTKNWNIEKRLGKYSEHPENWKNNSVQNMTHLVVGKNIKLIFDCGIDDFFYDVNKDLHNKMLLNNIPHDYIERPGKHNWAYWRNAIKYQMVFFDAFFNY